MDFRRFFRAKLGRFFVVPADTFDNVTGQFPIGFMIWITSQKENFTSAVADVYDRHGVLIGKKTFQAYDYCHYMNEWIKPYRAIKDDNLIIGKFPFKGNDFQNQNMVQIVHPNMDYNKAAGQFLINGDNLIEACIYFAARKCIPATWLNDRDQYLCPSNGRWKKDYSYQSDCLIYTIFSNHIISQYGTNHWIPFTEAEVEAKDNFESHFMSDFLRGKRKSSQAGSQQDLFGTPTEDNFIPLEHLSEAAHNVMDCGRALWRYYHSQPDANPNASLYDIRLYFQGTKTTEKGKTQMNSDSTDATYTELIAALRQSLKLLAAEIRPKVYEYGFLKK